jgi:hypothetical protein
VLHSSGGKLTLAKALYLIFLVVKNEISQHIISVSSQTLRYESYVIFTAEGEILRILEEIFEISVNDVEKFTFDRVSNVQKELSSWNYR